VLTGLRKEVKRDLAAQGICPPLVDFEANVADGLRVAHAAVATA
jgi:hypothetical protein